MRLTIAVALVGGVTCTSSAYAEAGNPAGATGTPPGQQTMRAPDGVTVAKDEATFSYRGRQISPSYAATHSLQCAERSGATTCYDTATQLEQAEQQGATAQGLTTSLATASSDTPLHIWGNADYGGWRVDTYTVCNWYNLTGSYNDSASSMTTGTHTGFLSVDNDGGGAQFSLGPWQGVPHLSSYYAYQVCSPYGCTQHTWNDEASSRRLGGC